MSSSLRICNLLLDSEKCVLDCCLDSKRTPLHLSVERSSLLYTQLILAYGASFFVKSWDGETPLMSAVRARNIWAVRHLLNHCEALAKDKLQGYLEEKNVQGDTALSLAIKTGQGEAISAIFSYMEKKPAAPLLLTQMCEARAELNFLSSFVLSAGLRRAFSRRSR